MAIGPIEAFAAIGSEAFDRAVAFYVGLLGREPDERAGDTYAAFLLPGLKLGVFRPSRARVEGFRNPTARQVGLNLVLRVPDLARAAAEVERLGGSADAPFDAPHGRELYAYDPDGNRLILVEG